MGHLPFAIAAYFLNSLAVLIDKYQLTKNLPSPFLYIFYISAFSLVSLFALPFTRLPYPGVFLIGSLATIVWTTGAYCMFSALKAGQASRVIPAIGVLTPLFLLIWGTVSGNVNLDQAWAVLLLVLGLLILVAQDLKGKFTFIEGFFEVSAALLFAIAYTLLHEAYTAQDFVTVFVWSKMILIPLAAVVLLIPKLRNIVVPKTRTQHPKLNWKSKLGILFLFGQACGGAADLLLQYSVSIATPALVNSLQGTQYVFIFLIGLLLSRKFPLIYGEHYNALVVVQKIFGIIVIAGGLFLLAFSQPIMKTQAKPALGATFSPRFASELGLNPRETFLHSVDALNIKRLRIPVYWDEVEKSEGIYDFSEVNFYLDEAEKRNIEVILVLGQKQPRWPECFIPDWAEDLTREERYKKIVQLVVREVSQFKKYENIQYWQLENEAMFPFGLCEKPDGKTLELLKNEVAVVHALDPRPIVLTDSGELSSWKHTLPLSDVFGTTMYRSSWNPVVGYIDYPTPPIFYPLKAKIISWLKGLPGKPLIVAELQAEPWAKGNKRIIDMSIEDQISGLTTKKLRENVRFASETGFSPVYLWGVEWWYWMELNGHPEYMQTVSEIIKEGSTSR